MIELDNDKLALLRHMRHDSRKSLSEISREEGISLHGLAGSLRQLEREVITKHVSILDLGKIGYNIRVHLVVGAKDSVGLRECIIGNQKVNSCSRTTDGVLYLECFFRNLKEMDEFKEKISEFGLARLEEHFVIEELKSEGFMPG
jgi:DNA-binding Lrp family transcriptional regulator